MKRIFLLVFLTLVLSQFLAAENLPFLEDYFYPGSVIISFTADAVGSRSGRFEIREENGVVKTHIESFNRLSEEYSFVELEQMHPFVRDSEWNDNGVYVQNIYRVRLAENRSITDIENARTALENDQNIFWAEYETINRTRYTPNDPDYHMLWYIPNTLTNLAWNYVQGSDEVIIAITDTGTKWNHEDLADNIWINEAELSNIVIDWDLGLILGGNGIDDSGSGKIDDVIGWDFVDNDNNPFQAFPGNEHGTHVAGCAGAVGDNEIGVVGPAMNTSLLICKGAATNHSSQGVAFGYQQIQYSADAGAHLINASWGGPGQGSYPNTIINYATAQGALVVAAAGNDNREHIPGVYEDYPADAENAFCVASTDQNDQKTSFSDFGTPIDITAPGVNIRSTWYNSQGQDSYNSTQGTSMSSPIVAGIAALVKTLHPELTPLQLRDRIMDTADFIDHLNPGYEGLLGTGRVNAFRATMYDKIPHISLFNTQITEAEGDGDNLPNPGEVINLVVSLENDYYFQTAFNVTATLTSSHPEVEIIQDTAEFPNISGGAIVFNNSNPFVFTTNPLLSDMDVPFALILTANQDDPDYPYLREIDFSVKLTLNKPNWPMQLPGATTSPALISDLNNDGTQHIVFGDTQGNLHCLTHNKAQAAGFPVQLGSNISTAVAIGDITGNGNKEIIAARQTGFIHAVSHTGEELFSYNAQGQIRANPILSRLTAGGDLKIVAVTFNNPKILVLNGDGSLYNEYTIPAGVLSSAAVGDINGDGNKEVVFVTTDGNLHAVSLTNGQAVSGFPVNISAASWHGPIVGDINGNGNSEIAVATVTGNVFLINSSGQIVFEKVTGNSIRTSIVASDITNNGSVDLTFADMQGNVYLIDANGNDHPGFPVNIGTAIESTPVLADLTRNHQQDIIFGGNNGYLYALTVNGTFAGNFPYYIGGNLIVSPTIGDVDLDDDVDILIPNENSYHFIDYKRASGSSDWICFKGDSYRRGNFDLRTLSTEMEDTITAVTKLLGNYPNPFNPSTTISFSLAHSSHVNINIYNIRGQLVKNLISEKLSEGNHNVIWDGNDNQNKPAGSGVYFYNLQADNINKTMKMMLLK